MFICNIYWYPARYRISKKAGYPIQPYILHDLSKYSAAEPDPVILGHKAFGSNAKHYRVRKTGFGSGFQS